MWDIEQLKEIKLFKDLSIKELESISNIARVQKYKAGEIIIKENEIGKELYAIVEGSVRISKLLPGGEKVTFTTLKKGSFFGELSLLTQKAHSATAEAIEDTQLVVISKIDFDRFIESSPQAGFKIFKVIIVEISDLLNQMNNRFIDMMGYMWH
ncbi:MAG: cyclic nucleotide-binding domain-containing protein [bacterium]|nr:cyclic nucleotide-binding domain-containing protein [bacterium]